MLEVKTSENTYANYKRKKHKAKESEAKRQARTTRICGACLVAMSPFTVIDGDGTAMILLLLLGICALFAKEADFRE